MKDGAVQTKSFAFAVRIVNLYKYLTAEKKEYVLEYRNTKLAIRYTYATNGHGIYAIDMKPGHEAEVPQFPTPDELWGMTFAEQNAWRDRFAAVPFEDRGGYFQGRYYQDIAIERVLEAIAAGKDRILLTLATGTGKTFVAFQIAWKLFHARWSKPMDNGQSGVQRFLGIPRRSHGANRTIAMVRRLSAGLLRLHRD